MVQILNISSTPVTNAVPPTIWDKILSYWWIALILVAVLALILFIIWRVLKHLKDKDNPLIKLSSERLKLCRQHKDKKRGKHYFKPSKNQPIVCEYFEDKKLIRRVVGYYMGDYYSKEGNRFIRFARKNCHKWLILPAIALLICNKTEEIEILQSISENEAKTIKVKLPANIDHFTDNEVTLLGCKSIDKLDVMGLFFVPILADMKRGQLNPQSFAYEQIKQVIIGEQMVTNLEQFVTATKRALDLNPELRGTLKIRDSSGSVEGESKK